MKILVKYITPSCLIAFLLLSFVSKKRPQNTVNTIVLDAGHGGKDPGAYCWNKDCNEGAITLGITLKLGKEIEKLMPNVKVLYTRKTDVYPTVHERATFANENKADLFVSIHCNSADKITKKEDDGFKTVVYYVGKGKKRKKMTKEVPKYKYVKYNNPANGLETYLWIPGHNDQKTDAIAAKENAEIYKDPEYKKKYGGGLDIKSAEFQAKAKLRTKKYFTRSSMLANLIQEEGAAIGRNDRNVRQRGIGIWVLQATAMPSVLVETGYISNPEEGAYLNSSNGQHEMALLIAKAIKKYNEELANNATTTKNSNLENKKLPSFFIKPDEIIC
jgi:N-acetylmuramoyl-L-alanine amidase